MIADPDPNYFVPVSTRTATIKKFMTIIFLNRKFSHTGSCFMFVEVYFSLLIIF